jgi:hypothetical protein
MRPPNAAHTYGPWRIREIAPDFTVADVWELPVRGGADDFGALVDIMANLDPTTGDSAGLRMLFRARWSLGRLLGWDNISERLVPGTDQASLAERLPPDLRNTVLEGAFGHVFTPLYRTDTEFAAEVSNQTVHALMHLAWVDRGEGCYHGEMAVYVKARGRLGREYMAAISPLRYWVVYPALMNQIERAWSARAGG